MMMNTPAWQRMKNWSDQFREPIKEIMGVSFVEFTDTHDDMHNAADFMIFKTRNAGFTGARIRSLCDISKFDAKSAGWYYQQYTIRQMVASGRKTELFKLLHDAIPEYYIYGFGNVSFPVMAEEEGKKPAIVYANVLDMKPWREHILMQLSYGKIPWVGKENGRAGDSKFSVFWLSDLPKGVIIKTIGEPPKDDVPLDIDSLGIDQMLGGGQK